MAEKKVLFSVGKKDLEISFFSGHGGGGQNRNRHMNCVRIRHPDSGASSCGQRHKEKQKNIRDALYSLAKHPKFKIWQNKKIWEYDNQKTVEQEVEEQMAEENLVTEILVNSKWIRVRPEDLSKE